MIKRLKKMDSTGDTVLEFDTEAAEKQAEQTARELFARMTAGGAAVFAVNRGEGKTDLRVKDFDALEQDNVIVPAIVAG